MRTDTVIGHRAVLDLLERETQSPAHAYLFVGPANVGKATVARRFAARLVAGSDAAVEDRAVRGVHPDVVLVEPDGRSALTVDRARQVVERASRAPVEADRQVFCFEEASLMNDEAANALLKTLEEPSGSTTFILVAGSEHDLPDTINSRCRTVVFGRVADEDIVAALVGSGVEGDQARRATSIAGGRPGLAVALATRSEVAEFRRRWMAVPTELAASPGRAYRLADDVLDAAKPLLEEIDRAGEDGRERERHEREVRRASAALLETGLELLASWYRDAVAAQVGAPVRNPDIPVRELASIAPQRAMANAERVIEAIAAFEANQRPQLGLAALFVELGAES